MNNNILFAYSTICRKNKSIFSSHTNMYIFYACYDTLFFFKDQHTLLLVTNKKENFRAWERVDNFPTRKEKENSRLRCKNCFYEHQLITNQDFQFVSSRFNLCKKRYFCLNKLRKTLDTFVSPTNRPKGICALSLDYFTFFYRNKLSTKTL